MAKLSILIPANNEMFLVRTIQDILEHIEDDTEILVGLDGYWPTEPIKDHPRVKIFHVTEPLGQRAMTNQLARLSKARYVAKVDAHCSFDQGFDRKMLEFFKEVGDDIVAVPVMRNLHAFNWVCPDGHTRYQGPSGACTTCGKPTEKDVVWIAKTRPESTTYCFDAEPHFQYFNEYKKRPEYLNDVKEKCYNESMSLQGSFFMATRHNYWKYELCDERAGSWGNQGLELACAAWLSGLRVLVNHKTWYAHLFRTQGEGFGFPYKISDKEVNKTKKYIRDKFYYGKMSKQTQPISFLIKKFWPVSGWTQENLDDLLKFESSVPNFGTKKLGILGIVSSVPGTMANHTTSVSSDGGRQEVSVPTMGLSGVPSSSTSAEQDIVSVGDESQVGGVTTSPVFTDVVKDGNVFAFSIGNGGNQPSIHKSVDSKELLIDPDLPVTTTENASPIPTPTNGVNPDFLKDSIYGLNGDFHNTSLSNKLTEVNGQ